MLLCSTVLGFSGVLSMPAARAQQAETLRISIPAQPLSSAIDAFSRTTGWQIGYSSPIDGTLRTRAVSGNMTPRQALQSMLAGTGISIRITGTSSAALVDPSATAVDLEDDGSLLLDTITIDAGGRGAPAGSGFKGTPDWVYETSDSVSVISQEAIDQSGARDTRELFNSVSGVYSGDGLGSAPGVSPNIRGLQDSGRVVVSIDGARQNAQDGGRYGAATTGLYGTAMVDTAFVRTIDIDKKTDASANNAGSLGGAVDFRLVKADDIISPDKQWGVEMDGATGTNAYEFAGSILGGLRLSDEVSLIVGLSAQQLGAYEPGHNGDADARFDLTDRDNRSSLVKLEGDYGDLRTSLAWLHQENRYAYTTGGDGTYGSRFDTRTDSVIGDLEWSPDDPRFDVKAKLWFNNSATDEIRDAREIISVPETYIDKRLTSFGGILENTSVLETAAGPLTLNYGVEAFRDDGAKSATSETIAENPHYATSYGTFSPPGTRDVASGFLNAEFDPVSWMTLNGGLRYDWHRLQGKPVYYNDLSYSDYVFIPCDPVSNHYSAADYYSEVFLVQNPTWTNYPVYENILFPSFCMPGTNTGDTVYIEDIHENLLEIDRSDGAWLPSATVEVRPLDGVDLFASYSESFRPPTLTEAFMTGSFAPGDYLGQSVAPNAYLRPEQARTFEIGANIRAEGLIAPDDAFAAKVVAFYREVDDYIVFGQILPDDGPGRTYQGFVNLDGTAYMRGLEIEANYDAGQFWLGTAASFLDVDWPQKTEVFSNGTTTTNGEVFAWSNNVPPRMKLVFDGGVRLFERKLTLGATVNHVTPTNTAYIDNEGDVVEHSGPYTTLDLRGSYRFNENTTLHASVTNVTDERYVPATGVYLAPGRTYMARLKTKF
ncbi:TonB-dependent receptor [Oricola sp.]|uniref:TonB-dependent receptor n=1 Tax=Oricola sp. TaxID=1979950 RepID=UPI0025EF0D20|nr:TonB-dependent receptor [Oricola sp.]MCI5074048.1 TonB-dependent hemoglobin/transferrin/lactoferrin family receptor [Oricola sp.]